ncbi:MAG: hypothetical protein QM426_02375 [Euryarchaeota archaeon]|nr:hypothetical protein [Euryarchaeota archaeon]
MKLYSFLLASFLLATFLTPALLAEPCSAAFISGNNITLERNGMIWDYDEKTTEDDAVFLRGVIDGETGDNNGFVNAWEILKMEVFLSDKMRKAIEEDPDVKLNASSDTVELEDIEFWVSKEALGRVNKSSPIINYATVSYNFKEELGPGTAIWLMGTPDSNVTINLPSGLDAERTEGLYNKSLGFENNCTVLKGNFSPEKNITVWLSKNESFKADTEGIKTKSDKNAGNESADGENSTLNAGVRREPGNLAGYFKNIFAEINRSLT